MFQFHKLRHYRPAPGEGRAPCRAPGYSQISAFVNRLRASADTATSDKPAAGPPTPTGPFGVSVLPCPAYGVLLGRRYRTAL